MLILDTKSGFDSIQKGQVLTIGNFDGVHLGHQRLLKTARQKADQLNAKIVVMTFDPHPAAILQPKKSPGLLTVGTMKMVLLESCGVDIIIVIRDSYEMLNLSPMAFVDEFLMRNLKPAAVVEGINFNFGYGRSGDITLLEQMGKERGFEVLAVEPQKVQLTDGQSQMASSTLVRHLLERGKVSDAKIVLGRPYRIIGQVVPGRGKGREIGFPTANIEPYTQIIPEEGVYAGLVSISDTQQQACKSARMLNAAISIGRARTFLTDHPLLFEAHILQGDIGDLYGKWLGVDFVSHIRPQQRFENVEALKKQIHEDCLEINRVLGENK